MRYRGNELPWRGRTGRTYQPQAFSQAVALKLPSRWLRSSAAALETGSPSRAASQRLRDLPGTARPTFSERLQPHMAPRVPYASRVTEGDASAALEAASPNEDAYG